MMCHSIDPRDQIFVKKKSVRSIKNLVTISAKQTFIKELQGSFPNKANAMGN